MAVRRKKATKARKGLKAYKALKAIPERQAQRVGQALITITQHEQTQLLVIQLLINLVGITAHK
jgi:hypothetical protein